MRRVVAPLLVAAVAGIGGGSAGAQRARSDKQLLPFAWISGGQTRIPVQRSRIRIARTRAQAKSWYDEISSYFGFAGRGDFRDDALIGAFYAGNHPAVHVTKVIVTGTNLNLYLVVAPPNTVSPSQGAYNIVAVPRRAIEMVQTVRVLGVDEKPLADVPYLNPPTPEPNVTIREDSTPHAGRLFKAVVASFAKPDSFLVTNVGCRGSVGGRWSWRGDFKVLHGARLVRPIIRRDYTSTGFVRAITCSWRLPRSAAGKQLVLGENNCYDDCPTGFTLDYAYVGGDQVQGGEGTSWSGRSWTIAR